MPQYLLILRREPRDLVVPRLYEAGAPRMSVRGAVAPPEGGALASVARGETLAKARAFDAVAPLVTRHPPDDQKADGGAAHEDDGSLLEVARPVVEPGGRVDVKLNEERVRDDLDAACPASHDAVHQVPGRSERRPFHRREEHLHRCLRVLREPVDGLAGEDEGECVAVPRCEDRWSELARDSRISSASRGLTSGGDVCSGRESLESWYSSKYW